MRQLVHRKSWAIFIVSFFVCTSVVLMAQAVNLPKPQLISPVTNTSYNDKSVAIRASINKLYYNSATLEVHKDSESGYLMKELPLNCGETDPNNSGNYLCTETWPSFRADTAWNTKYYFIVRASGSQGVAKSNSAVLYRRQPMPSIGITLPTPTSAGNIETNPVKVHLEEKNGVCEYSGKLILYKQQSYSATDKIAEYNINFTDNNGICSTDVMVPMTKQGTDGKVADLSDGVYRLAAMGYKALNQSGSAYSSSAVNFNYRAPRVSGVVSFSSSYTVDETIFVPLGLSKVIVTRQNPTPAAAGVVVDKFIITSAGDCGTLMKGKAMEMTQTIAGQKAELEFNTSNAKPGTYCRLITKLILGNNKGELTVASTQFYVSLNDNDCPLAVQYNGGPYDATGSYRNQGGYYRAVKIAGRCWLRDNINYGEKISTPNSQINKSGVQKYCFANYNQYCNDYGALYESGEAQCPNGWRAPTRAELNEAIDWMADRPLTYPFFGTKDQLAGWFRNQVAGNYQPDFYERQSKAYLQLYDMPGYLASCTASSCEKSSGGQTFYTGSAASLKCIKDNGQIVAINGVCGSNSGQTLNAKPVDNLCLDNSLPSVSGDGPWTWTCAGKNGGADANCRAEKKVVVDNSGCPATVAGDGGPYDASGVTRNNGGYYRVMKVGSLCWTIDNWNGGQFKSVPENTEILYPNRQTDIAGIQKYCYGSNQSNCSTYGGLYETSEVQCPSGWRIPTRTEFNDASDYFANHVSEWPSFNIQGRLGGFFFNALDPFTSTYGFSKLNSWSYFQLGNRGDALAICGPNNCEKSNGGQINFMGSASSIRCVKAVGATNPINGSCGSSHGQSFSTKPTANLCISGTASTVSGDGPWTWDCLGQNGGTSVTCTANKNSAAINGVCGSAHGLTLEIKPYYNLCLTGTASVVSGTGPWTWTCYGKFGGLDASCLANKKNTSTPGKCGSANGGNFTSKPATNLCLSGTASTVSGNGPWTWTCSGANGGELALCQANKTSSKIDANCGSAVGSKFKKDNQPTANLCLPSTVSNSVPTLANGKWTWTCYGQNGGSNILCSANEDISSSACGGVASVNYMNEDYGTVSIGSQCWLNRNLNSGSFVRSFNNDNTPEKYCYGDNASGCDTMLSSKKSGGLYNWNETINYNSSDYSNYRGICPAGWHIPDNTEWQTLIDNVGGANQAKSQLLAGGFSGFDATFSGSCLPSSCFNRCTSITDIHNNGDYDQCNFRAWSRTRLTPQNFVITGQGTIQVTSGTGAAGYALNSVRCIKDSASNISNVVSALSVLNPKTEYDVAGVNPVVQLKIEAQADFTNVYLRQDSVLSLSSNLPGVVTLNTSLSGNHVWVFDWNISSLSAGNYSVRSVAAENPSAPISQSNEVVVKIVKNSNLQNIKNASKYSNKEVFMVNDSSWQTIMSLVPLTTWTDSNGQLNKYPALIYQNDSGAWDIDSSVRFLQQYKPSRVTLVDHSQSDASRLAGYLISEAPVGAGLANNGQTVVNLPLSSYLSYWSSYNDIVVVENNYEKALSAAAYASLINAPLIVKGSALDVSSIYNNKNIICVGQTGLSCNETYSADTLKQAYLAKVLQITGKKVDKIIVANPKDWNYSYHTSRASNSWEGFVAEKTGDYVTDFFGKHSAAAPFLAAAKYELILPLSDDIGATGVDTTDPYFGGTSIRQSNPGSNCNDSTNKFRCSYWQNKISETVNSLGWSSSILATDKSRKVYDGYITIMADPQSIPLRKSSAIGKDAADKEIFANIDGSEYPDVAYGRIIGFTISDASAMTARSIFHSSLNANKGFALFSSKANGKSYGNDFNASACSALKGAGYTDRACLTSNLDHYIDKYDVNNYDQQAMVEGAKWANNDFDYYHDHGSANFAGVWTQYIPDLSNTFVATMACSTAEASANIDQVTNFSLMALRKGAVAYLGAVDSTYETTVDKDVSDKVFYSAKNSSIGAIFRNYTGIDPITLFADPTLVFAAQPGQSGANKSLLPQY